VTVPDDELLHWLDLERIDRDIFRGRPTPWRRDGTLYGGQVAAQALMAAARTVPAGRAPHSLHGYFLRPGHHGAPVTFLVDRDRDGRSFSARRVAAMQDGEVIWEMACSFHESASGPEYVHGPPSEVPAPEVSPPIDVAHHTILDVHVPLSPIEQPTWPVDRAWVRVNRPLGDDPVVHACLHTFASDVTTGFVSLDLDGSPPAGPSIDHALWFHHLGRADDWTLYDCVATKVGGHRGLYTGTVRDRAGDLVAFLAQEMLLRPPRKQAS